MRNPIDMSRFEQLKASGDLPSPRGVALAIIRMAQEPDVSMAELTRVIKSDPAFVGRLIKAANGIVGAQRRSVVSVHEALMVLGLPAVRNMALGFSLLSHYRKGGCTQFDYRGFWSSSLIMALAMQVLALRIRAVAADEAFSIGLLARVGELALATVYPREYGQVLDDMRADPALALLDLEQRAFAMDHGELGVAMLANWGVPAAFTGPVLHHELHARAPFAAGGREAVLTECLALSRAIADLCLAGEAAAAAQPLPAMLSLAAGLGLSRDDLIAVCEVVGREWGEWGVLLELDAAPPPPFSALLQDEAGDAASADAASGTLSPMRVLVVDVEPVLRDQIGQLLDAQGCEAFAVEAAGELMERALAVEPHLMVLDWERSGDDVLRTIRALRATRIGRGVYILLLTRCGDNADARLQQAVDAGVDDIAVKPLRFHVLGARLRAGLRVLRLQQELEREREEMRHFAAELAIINRRLQDAALTDALTGFPNRRYAIDRIGQEWSTATRSQRALSCMIIDLDNFKQINDTRGHDVGDAVLCRASDVMREALRSQDVICRTGGDEFLVICPETALDAALGCAERLREALEGVTIEAEGATLKLTISVGVAERDDAMADIDALIKRADQGAYLAKRRGRNQVATVQLGAASASQAL